MSQENVELVRQAFEEFLAGKADFGVGLVHPEAVWDSTEMDLLDAVGILRGPEGVRAYWRAWLAAWESIEFEYELVDAGDSVVALIDQRMRGRASGIEVTLGKYAQVYTFRDGLIVHWKIFTKQADALAAVGLGDRAAGSPDNVEVVRRIYAEWAKGNFRAGTELFDAGVVLVIRDDFPDAGVYVGVDEIRAYMRQFLADWTDAAIEAEDIVGGGDAVAVSVRQHATGTGSGLPVDMRYWQVWTLREGAVTRIESVRSRSEALEVAGLRE